MRDRFAFNQKDSDFVTLYGDPSLKEYTTPACFPLIWSVLSRIWLELV